MTKKEIIDIPTNWREMNYCIIGTLQYLKGNDKISFKDRWFHVGVVQMAMEDLYGNRHANYDWTSMNVGVGKAFWRSLGHLKDLSIVIADNNGSVQLSSWKSHNKIKQVKEDA